jgi:hypothetical protein
MGAGATPYDAVQATGIPRLGDAYPVTSSNTTTTITSVVAQRVTMLSTGAATPPTLEEWLQKQLRCTDIEARPVEPNETPFSFIVTATYTTSGSTSKDGNNTNSDGSDSGLPPSSIQISTSHSSRVLEFDAMDNTMLVTNSAGSFFDPPVEYDAIDYTINLSMNRSKIDPAELLEYAGTVNEKELSICGVDIPVANGRISDIRWRVEWLPPTSESGKPSAYAAIDITIDVNRQQVPLDARCSTKLGPTPSGGTAVTHGRLASVVGTWGAIVLDQGWEYLAPVPGSTGGATVLTQLPANATRAAKLNGQGGLLLPFNAAGYTPSQLRNAFYKCFHRYKLKDWSNLNLPTAMFTPQLGSLDRRKMNKLLSATYTSDSAQVPAPPTTT